MHTQAHVHWYVRVVGLDWWEVTRLFQIKSINIVAAHVDSRKLPNQTQCNRTKFFNLTGSGQNFFMMKFAESFLCILVMCSVSHGKLLLYLLYNYFIVIDLNMCMCALSIDTQCFMICSCSSMTSSTLVSVYLLGLCHGEALFVTKLMWLSHCKMAPLLHNCIFIQCHFM